MDIVQNCQVVGIRRDGNQVTGVDTTKGFIKAKKVAVVAAGNTTALADMAGVRLPLESHPLQALVSEPIKPVVNTVVMSNAVHAYISQSDKGDLVIGAGVVGLAIARTAARAGHAADRQRDHRRRARAWPGDRGR